MASILFIDDEEVILKSISGVLRQLGYRVLEAVDGEEGLRLCKQECPDLVITDIRMPQKSGFEIIQELREDYPEIEIIALTGVLGLSLPDMVRLGADRVFRKPVRLQALCEAIEKLLKEESSPRKRRRKSKKSPLTPREYCPVYGL